MQKLLLLTILISLAICDPSVPIWVDQWEQKFVQESRVDGEVKSTPGIYSYDYTNNRDNIWREDCRVDIFTRDLFTEKTACSQLTHQGKRYVYAEEENFCCLCGTIGLQRPDWMQFAGGKFTGYKKVDGQYYNEFTTYAGPKLFPILTYYNTKTDIQSFLYRPDLFQKLMIFDQQSYSTTFANPSILDFPQACQAEKLDRCKGYCHMIPGVNAFKNIFD